MPSALLAIPFQLNEDKFPIRKDRGAFVLAGGEGEISRETLKLSRKLEGGQLRDFGKASHTRDLIINGPVTTASVAGPGPIGRSQPYWVFSMRQGETVLTKVTGTHDRNTPDI